MDNILKFMVRFVVKFQRKREGDHTVMTRRGETIWKGKMGVGRAAKGAFRRTDHFRSARTSAYGHQADVPGYAVSILWSDLWSGQTEEALFHEESGWIFADYVNL